jgi:hypothetical protein
MFVSEKVIRKLTIVSIATDSTDSTSISAMNKLVHLTARSSKKGKYLFQSGRSHWFVVRAELRRLVAPTTVAVEREKVRRRRMRRVRVR